MPLLSKFRKSEGDASIEEDSPSAEADEEDGLLISVEEQSPAPASEPAAEARTDEDESALQGEIDDLLPGAEAAAQEETDDLLAAAPGESAGTAEAQPAEATPAEAAPATQEAPTVKLVSAGAEDGADEFDDPLAAFRSEDVESDISHLTKGIEDISIEELLIGLREAQALLNSAGNAAESPEPADG